MKTILFSGGYDSTYLLNMLLQTENEVRVISVNACFSGEKTNREKKAREKILNYLKSKYYTSKIDVINVDVKFDIAKICNTGLVQPLVWLPMMQLFAGYEENCELYLSYISGDQAPIFLNEFKTIIEASMKFQNTFDMYSKRNVTIKTPLLSGSKSDILYNLYKVDKWLLENCTTCEDHENIKDNCGKCEPCRHLRSAALEIISNPNISRDCREYFQEFIKDKFGDIINVTLSSDKLKFETVDNVTDKCNECVEE